MENITHVRNPLTIIGVFAASTEISGTIVLPSLAPESQGVFVYFLMGFPVILVLAFFTVLWFRHHVLYAPSDYRTDDAFRMLAERHSPAEKLQQDIIEEGEQDLIASSTSSDDAADPTPKPKETPEGRAQSRAKTLEHSVRNGYLAENMAIDLLSHEMGVPFDRNVSFLNNKRIYDAAYFGSKGNVVIEVKYSSRATHSTQKLRQLVEVLKELDSSLPSELKGNVHGIGVLVLDKKEDVEKLAPALQARFKENFSGMSSNASFRLRVFSLEDITSTDLAK